MGRLKDVLVNLALSAAALVFVLLVFELIVFRFVLPGSDLPRNAFVDDVIRYAPNQQGVWRVRNDIAAPFAINAQGWNSGTGDYELPRSQGTMRIAFVGDSYVEALQVPHDASLAEHVARTGAAQNQRIETYRFAISGAPMSQYLHIVEREVVKYRPDWIVVLLVGNDYDESFIFQPGRYTSAFRKLRVAGGEVTGEIPPTPWEPGWADTLRQLATVRFFQFRWQVRPETLAAWVVASGRADTPTPDLLGPRRADLAAATRYTLARLAAAAQGMGARLLIVTNADLTAVQTGAGGTPERALHRLAQDAAEDLGIARLDLEPVFQADWLTHRERLNFPSDGHWNARAHSLAGTAVAHVLLAIEPAQPTKTHR